MDDVFELFRNRLDEITEYKWGSVENDDQAIKVFGHKIEDGEDVLDAIARHMVEALTRRTS